MVLGQAMKSVCVIMILQTDYITVCSMVVVYSIGMLA